jgi:hypothetical protein
MTIIKDIKIDDNIELKDDKIDDNIELKDNDSSEMNAAQLSGDERQKTAQIHKENPTNNYKELHSSDESHNASRLSDKNKEIEMNITEKTKHQPKMLGSISTKSTLYTRRKTMNFLGTVENTYTNSKDKSLISYKKLQDMESNIKTTDIIKGQSKNCHIYSDELENLLSSVGNNEKINKLIDEGAVIINSELLKNKAK